MKKVLLLVVDALSHRIVVPALGDGRLPNLAALAGAGTVAECTAIFPSITPAATSSIITGRYPREHGIAGAFWFDPDKGRVAYFGSDFWVILAEGAGRFFEDALVRLNRDRLKADTILQIVERAGRTAGSLNYLIFRGDTVHAARVPTLMSLLPGVPSRREVHGPSLLSLGDFVAPTHPRTGESLSAPGGLTGGWGFRDASTAELLLRLAGDRALPDFTVAYFPDNDDRSHEVGPQEAFGRVADFDRTLGELAVRCGGVGPMLRDLCVIVTGDHSQSELRRGGDSALRLDQVLSGFSIADAGEPWDGDERLVVCPNLRTVQIYVRAPNPALLDRLVGRLLDDSRIDQVIWRDSLIDPADGRGRRVATADRGRLHFRAGTGGGAAGRDAYGNEWTWEGSLAAVDGSVGPDGRLRFGDYPDAFERIAGGLDCPDSGDVWATARPGWEFALPRTSPNAGGSHGSLHVLDSLSPLIVAGAPPGTTVPRQARTVDIVPLALAVLGLPAERPVGAGHQPRED